MKVEVKQIKLDVEQQHAVDLATDIRKRIVGVSGPAGSGKTTILKQVREQLLYHKMQNVAFAAPTGKAARRIKEATGIPATTIHKLLEYNRPGARDEKGKALDPTMPARGRKNPLDQQVILVDEYAMVNYELHNNLIAALPRGGCIRAFGDVYQLAPIEPYLVRPNNGQRYKTPFQKILNEFVGTHLETIYRQGEGSNILREADLIRRGRMPTINDDLGDFHVRITDRPVDMLRKYVSQRYANGVDFRQIENQIIVPAKRSWVGTKALNEVLRLLLNPSPAQKLSLPRQKWDKDKLTIGLGDKVVCTENTYDLRDYTQRFDAWDRDGNPVLNSFIECPETKQMLNGETGIVTQIYPDGSVDVDFGDRTVEIPAHMNEYWAKEDTIIDVYPLKAIDLAYALTTHKCQGSEFANTCYVLNKSTVYNQSRQNFYTAITRATTSAMIFTDQLSLRASMKGPKA